MGYLCLAFAKKFLFCRTLDTDRSHTFCLRFAQTFAQTDRQTDLRGDGVAGTTVTALGCRLPSAETAGVLRR